VKWASEAELVKLNLNLVDNKTFRKLRALLNDAEALPKSVVNAQL
jgi:hypothetical protein